MTGDANSAEKGAEQILLLTVEIDLERLDICQCTKARLAVFGLEVVMVIRDISDEINCPSIIGFVTDICLIIKKVRMILSSCF